MGCEAGDHFDIAAQVGHRDVLDGLEQAGLVVEQQDHGIGRVEQGRAAPEGSTLNVVWARAWRPHHAL